MSARAWVRAIRPTERALRGCLVLATALVLVGVGDSSAGATKDQRLTKKTATKTAPAIVKPTARPHRVIAYYFHTTYRCPSCRAIEAYSREAIQNTFADELVDGRLVWKVVNVELEGNEHFVKDYGLYTKSLVLVNEIRGKPTEWKTLEKVWQFLRDKPKFLDYVRAETRSYLADRS